MMSPAGLGAAVPGHAAEVVGGRYFNIHSDRRPIHAQSPRRPNAAAISINRSPGSLPPPGWGLHSAGPGDHSSGLVALPGSLHVAFLTTSSIREPDSAKGVNHA